AVRDHHRPDPQAVLRVEARERVHRADPEAAAVDAVRVLGPGQARVRHPQRIEAGTELALRLVALPNLSEQGVRLRRDVHLARADEYLAGVERLSRSGGGRRRDRRKDQQPDERARHDPLPGKPFLYTGWSGRGTENLMECQKIMSCKSNS